VKKLFNFLKYVALIGGFLLLALILTEDYQTSDDIQIGTQLILTSIFLALIALFFQNESKK
jgi:ABC-type transport system involved in cytochrome c biogenesis permease subunit